MMNIVEILEIFEKSAENESENFLNWSTFGKVIIKSRLFLFVSF